VVIHPHRCSLHANRFGCRRCIANALRLATVSELDWTWAGKATVPSSGLSVLASRAHCRCAASTKRWCQLPRRKCQNLDGLRTIVAAHDARQIFFKVWTGVVFFVLVAVADVMSVIADRSFCVGNDTHMHTLGSDFATSTSSPLSLSACHGTSSSDSALDSSSLSLVLASEECAAASSSLW
jgi:hypothetical protein